MKQGMEALRGIRCKLRMMGVELSGPSYIYGDNMSLVIHLWRQYVSDTQHSAIGVGVEEKVELGLLPCSSRSFRDGRVLDGTCVYAR